MNRIYTIIIFACLSIASFANTTVRDKEIDGEITDFWSNITRTSDKNGVDLDYYIKYVSSRFEGDDVKFKLNNQKITLASFMYNYKQNVLKNDYISHYFERTTEIKKDDRGERLYKIQGKLKREYIRKNTKEFVVMPIDISLLIFYDERKPIDARVKILELVMEQDITRVYPHIFYEYDFDVKPAKTQIDYTAESVKFYIISRKRKVTEYPRTGIDPLFAEYEPVKVTGIADYAKLSQLNDTEFVVSFRENYSSSPRSYVVSFKQDGGKSQDITIKQSFPYKPNKIKKFFEVDKTYYDRLWDISLHYSPKYNIGVSAMYTPEESRFSFGGIIASNFDSFRGIDWCTEVSVSTLSAGSAESSVGSIWPTSDIVNGYKITQETLNPEENNFSSIFDPYSEAKHYKSRTLILANFGFHITNWWNISLGIGPIIYRDLYFMETTYDVTRTSYTPTQNGLPAIEDVYTYRKHTGPQNYYFKNPTKWDLGIRPAVNFSIPLGDDFYMPIGCGYIISALGKLEDCNSLDFNIGISFYY